MWIEEDFSEPDFWLQTGRSYQEAMEARHAARKAEYRDDTRRAWQMANFAGAAFNGKLRDLNHYMPNDHAKDQNSAAMLGFLFKMKRKGVPMTVERIDRAA